MKKKLVPVFILVYLVFGNMLFAQESASGKLGTLKTNDGKLIDLYDYVSKDGDSWSFHDDKGKFKVVKSKIIEWVILGPKKYLSHNIRDNNKEQRILELVALSGKYKLFYYDGYNNFIYIFDQNDKLMEDPIKLISGAEAGSQGNNEKAIQTITRYFSDCNDLLQLINENLKSRNDLFHGFGFKSCPGATEIETLFK